jgi:7-carboxy-7-deazaguanine synthase
LLLLSRTSVGEPEIFASIQGEGVTTGLPSVLVRLATCNLACSWCDTRYTWDWENYDHRQLTLPMDVHDILESVNRLGPRNVVITGGEPLLQQHRLLPLAESLKSRGFRVEVETNGTVRPRDALGNLVDQWNVSPKLSTSGNSQKKRRIPNALEWFGANANAFFKFVIASPDDLLEVDGIVQAFSVPCQRVVLMPEGTDVNTLCSRSTWLVDECVRRGYRYTTRLHILLWGNERGR